jgi:hypothetical protein
MSNIKLTAEQGDLAFHILAIMQESFPENPEQTIAALECVLRATKEACIEDGTYTDE